MLLGDSVSPWIMSRRVIVQWRTGRRCRSHKNLSASFCRAEHWETGQWSVVPWCEQRSSILRGEWQGITWATLSSHDGDSSTLPSLAILDLTSNGITHKGLSLIANALAARDSTRTDTQQVSTLKGNCPSHPTLPNKLMAPVFCNQIKSKSKANSLKQKANYTNESRLHTYHTDLRQIWSRFVHVASTHIVRSLFFVGLCFPPAQTRT